MYVCVCARAHKWVKVVCSRRGLGKGAGCMNTHTHMPKHLFTHTHPHITYATHAYALPRSCARTCAHTHTRTPARSHAHRTARPSRSQFPGDQSGCERREVRGGSMVQHGRVGADAHFSKEWKTGGCGRAVVIYRDLYAQ